MARPERTRTAPPAQGPRKPQASDRMLPAYVLAGVILVIGVPAAVMLGVSWVRVSEPTPSGQAAPNWVRSESVQATTSDGESVKARVAIDASDRSSRASLEENRTQVAMMLQICLGAHDRPTLQRAGGMNKLSKDMERRLNEFLAARHEAPVRAVVVQDLLFSKV
jgi:flagellar basal body-associated protein FliL